VHKKAKFQFFGLACKANAKVTRVTLLLVMAIFLKKIKYILNFYFFFVKKNLRANDKVTRVHT